MCFCCTLAATSKILEGAQTRLSRIDQPRPISDSTAPLAREARFKNMFSREHAVTTGVAARASKNRFENEFRVEGVGFRTHKVLHSSSSRFLKQTLLWESAISYEKKIKLNFSGNQVFYTISWMLPVKNMLCSKPHCQKYINSTIFSYNICCYGSDPQMKRESVGRERTVSTRGIAAQASTLPPLFPVVGDLCGGRKHRAPWEPRVP